MKKTTIALAIAVAGFAAVAQAAPQDNTWYTGAKVSWSRYADTGFYDNRVSNETTKPNQLGAGGFFGYQANQYVGFELGYDWLGRMTYDSDRTNANSAAFRGQGVHLTAKLSYPITNDLDIYTRLGGMTWWANSTTHDATGKHKQSDTGVSPVYAAGLEYAITKSVATRLDYQWTSNIGSGSNVGTRPDNSSLSLGVAYRFGQETPMAPVVVPSVETKRFALKSDVLFNFDKSTLRPEGQQVLDDLFIQLKNIHPTGGSSAVIGYTDRIGSEKYNQKLSEERARSVVNYLVNKGIPEDKISARGMGKADPVTGDTCNGVKPRKALIECLAPDRRVEIEITGTREVISQITY